MTERKTERVIVRITPTLRRRFEEALKRQGHTQSEALTMLITQYCEQAEKSVGSFRCEAQDA